MVVAPSERTEAAHSGIPQHARCSSAEPAKLVSLHLYLPDFECFFKQSSMPRLAVSVSVPVSCGGVTGGTSGVGKGAGEGAKVGCTSAESRGPGLRRWVLLKKL